MKTFIREAGFLVGLTLCVSWNVCGQVVTSVKDGIWNDPSVWSSGEVPAAGNVNETIVDHEVVIPTSASVEIDYLVVNGSLTIAEAGTMNIVAGASSLLVNGVLIIEDGGVLNGTSASNTFFASGSKYLHRQGPLGFIPYATWHEQSIFEIAGFRSQGYINIAHSDSWKQHFGHVIYNCPEQTTAFVDLNGYLRNISGDFIVMSTNGQALRLSTTQGPVINIGGDFIVEGASRIWLSTSPSSATINVLGDFRYRSTAAGISYLTTRGTVALNVHGAFEMSSPGRIHMATTAADSTGARLATLTIQNDFVVSSGTIIAPPSPGKGRIYFVGSGVQAVDCSSHGTTFQGNIDFLVESGAIVSLGNSVLSNTSGSLVVRGTLQVGSSHPNGAIQNGNQGNIQVSGARTFESGSTLDYNGEAMQWIGEGHPASPAVNLICSNPAGVTLLKDIVVRDLQILSDLLAGSHSVTVHGNMSVSAAIDAFPQRIIMSGTNQQLNAGGKAFDELLINNEGNTVTLTAPMQIKRMVSISSPNLRLISNGYLTLLSSSDQPSGSASVASLPPGSEIAGDVTIQRHMDGEGRIYRYLSSSVSNATVADMQDDFPVTGTFVNASTGGGMESSSPSLYRYDASSPTIEGGWEPFPTSGTASSNVLMPGRGYAAFIRNTTTETVWDVRGPVNQGSINIPVVYTPSNGWNLVGNPYPSAIAWEEGGWTRQNVSNVMAIRDNGAGGVFRYWDMEENYTGADGKIALGQAFWIRATGPNPGLAIHEDAKAIVGAEFLRKSDVPISGFSLTLTRDSVDDKVFFKLREDATDGVDRWDGLKLDNDLFDISFANRDSVAFAIFATNRLPCDTILEIRLRDLLPGKYYVNLETRLDFSRYSFVLIDRFLKSEQELQTANPVELVVTDDKQSAAYNRIALRMKERPPKLDVLFVDTLVCAGGSRRLLINGDAGVEYSVWKGTKLLAEATLDRDTLTLPLPDHQLLPGSKLFSVMAKSICHTVKVDTVFEVRNDTLMVFASSLNICAGAKAKLTATSNFSYALFAWFSDIDDSAPVCTDETYITDPIYKSRSYFVEAFTKNGCRSNRVEVVVSVLSLVDRFQFVPGSTSPLSDNRDGGSYHQNFTVGQNPTFMKDQPDGYKQTVDSMTCFRSYQKNPKLSAGKKFKIKGYPNPVKDKVRLLSHETIIHATIHDSKGAFWGTVSKSDSTNPHLLELDLSKLPAGVYYVTIQHESGKVESMTVMKIE